MWPLADVYTWRESRMRLDINCKQPLLPQWMMR